jgi:hypothetical protein
MSDSPSRFERGSKSGSLNNMIVSSDSIRPSYLPKLVTYELNHQKRFDSL